jgi:hypothetical protein
VGITNKFLIDIVNDIAVKLNGVNADNVHRPYKSEIIKAVNQAENAVLIDKPQYDFLRKTAIIPGWQPALGTQTKQLANGTGVKSAFNSAFIPTNPGAVTYFAEKYQAPSPGVLTPSSLLAQFYTFASTGKLNCQFDAYICWGVTENSLDPTQDPAEVTGYPDLDNVIATANTINCVNDVFDASAGVQWSPLPNAYAEIDINFTFPTAVPVSNNQVYWVVVKFTSQYNNNLPSPNVNARTILPGLLIGSISGTSLLWQPPAYPITANKCAIGTFNFKLTLNNAVFMAKNIPMPLDCNIPVRIGQPYNGSLGGVFFLQLGTDALMYRQFNVPPNTFSVTGEDPVTGAKLVSLNSAVTLPTVGVPVTYPTNALAAQYYLDYIAMGAQMVNDTDTPCIPVEYRDLLVYKAMTILYAMNNGLPMDVEMIEKEFLYLLNKMNMKCMPQRVTSIAVNTGGYTSAMAPTRDTTLSQSLLTMQWPNTWQSSFGSGQNIGPLGGL